MKKFICFALMLVVLVAMSGCATNFSQGERASVFESHMYLLRGSHANQMGIGKPADNYSQQVNSNPNLPSQAAKEPEPDGRAARS